MASPTEPEKYSFLLFISGMSGKSVVAIENLRKICDEYLQGNCDIRIVDLNREPLLATEHQIIAIPTLIKTGPMPPRTILGDLSDTAKVLRILEITK
ncbi:MAG TPA: circadian clock KaiB family protein [Flavobacterium sp.]